MSNLLLRVSGVALGASRLRQRRLAGTGQPHAYDSVGDLDARPPRRRRWQLQLAAERSARQLRVQIDAPVERGAGRTRAADAERLADEVDLDVVGLDAGHADLDDELPLVRADVERRRQ